MKIQKLMFLKADLEEFGENERDFFIGAAHISNEINVLSKLFQWSIARPSSEIERRVMVTQGLMLGRLLDGKLYECWKYLEKAFFGVQLTKLYCPLLNFEEGEALQELKSYFSGKNTIATVRNKFSFHYDATHVGAGFKSLADDTVLEIYLGEENANTMYAFSDDIIGRGMVDAINPKDDSDAMSRFFLETSRISGLISVFLGGCMRVAIDRHLPQKKINDIHAISLGVLPSWSDVRIPFFTQSPSHFSFKLTNGKTLTWGEHSVASPSIF